MYALPAYRLLAIDTMVSYASPSRWEKQVTVVTEWEGTDHETGTGCIFCSTVFGGKLDTHMIRTPTEEEAERVHHKLVQAVRKELRLV